MKAGSHKEVGGIYGFDIEADTLLPFKPDGHLICASYCGPNINSKPHTVVIEHPDIDCIDPEINTHNLQTLNKILANPNNIIVGHNLGYDCTFWEAWFRRKENKTHRRIQAKLFDTMIAHSLIDETYPNGLNNIAYKYLNKGKQSNVNPKKLWDEPIEEVVNYNQWDAKLSRELYLYILQDLKHKELLFDKLTKALHTVINVQLRGIPIDKKRIIDQSFQLQNEIDSITIMLREQLGNINLNSPKQLAEVLFEDLAWPIVAHTKTGSASTSEEALSILKLKFSAGKTKRDKKNLTILTDLLNLRKREKLHGTYLTPLQEKFIGWDDKLHSSYFLGRGTDDFHNSNFGTVTGRLSSRNPNLQNQPPEVRGVFIPNKGWRIFTCDHSQLELRIAGFLSGDEVMLEAFKDNKMDIHTFTMSKILEMDYEELVGLTREGEWKLKRKVFKTFNFALIYGAWWLRLQEGLRRDLGILLSEQEIKKIVRGWENTFKQFNEWKKKVHKWIQVDGQVINEVGRVRHFFDPKERKSYNFSWQDYAEFQRQGLNAIIQSLASDINLFGWSMLEDSLLKTGGAHSLLSVHDSVDGEYNPRILKSDKLKEIVNDCMITKVNSVLEKEFGIDTTNLHLAVEIKTNLKRWE